MQQLRASNLFKSIGGRWAISLRGLSFYGPIAVIFVPIGENAYTNWGLFLRWSFVAVASLIPAGILLYILNVTVFKDRTFNPLPPYSVAILGFVIGATRGATTSILVGLVGLPSEFEPTRIFLRALNAGTLAAMAFPVISLLLVTWDQWKLLRKEAIEELVKSYSDSQNAAGESLKREIEYVAQFNRDISSRISESKSSFEALAQISMQNYWKELAENLRTTSRELIRPLSHEFQNISNFAQPTKFTHIQYMLRNIRVEIHWIVFFFIVMEFRYFVMNMGLTLGTIDLIAHALVLSLVLFLLKPVIEMRRGLVFLIFSITLTLAMLWICLHAVQIALEISTPPTRNFFEALLIILSMVVIGAISALRNRQILELGILKELIDEQEVAHHLNRREISRVSQQIASHLHGGVQSRLMASALAIEKAGSAGDIDQLKQEVESAYSGVTFDSSKIISKPFTSIEEVNKLLEDLWSGVVSLAFNDQTSEVELPQRVLRGYEQAATEAIANGFRHGGASSIEIATTADEFEIRIEIRDNGSGVKSSKFGLGAELFDFITRKNWSLEEVEGSLGSRLVLNIPL